MQILIERGRVLPFSELPPKSIALDGYCQQVMDSLLLGLDPQDLTIYLNDIDGDTHQRPSRG